MSSQLKYLFSSFAHAAKQRKNSELPLSLAQFQVYEYAFVRSDNVECRNLHTKSLKSYLCFANKFVTHNFITLLCAVISHRFVIHFNNFALVEVRWTTESYTSRAETIKLLFNVLLLSAFHEFQHKCCVSEYCVLANAMAFEGTTLFYGFFWNSSWHMPTCN